MSDPAPLTSYTSLGFREKLRSYDEWLPQFPESLSDFKYEGQPYTPEGMVPESSDFEAQLPYKEVFWETFFEVMFPGVSQEDFNRETSMGTSGGYYTQLYKAAAVDFYDAYFRGRDDLGSSAGQGFVTEQTWSALSNEEQKAVITSYLTSRDTVQDKEFTSRMLLNNLQLRRTNVFVWVAKLMVTIMGDLQSNTIDAGRYATRLAQTQTAISREMASSAFRYQTLATSTDYATMALNENNGKRLEDLRTFRTKIQKETDKATAFLESSNAGVETMGSNSLRFLNKARSLLSVFFQKV